VAHDLQTTGQERNMATTMKLIKVLQEIKGIAQITNRRPAPRPPLLYLMALRSKATPAINSRRKLAVETATIPTAAPIKINHVKSDQPAQPAVIL
jgi:hypothetical protein